MIILPQTEPAHVSELHIQEHDTHSSHKCKPEKNEPGESGVFAKLLAALSDRKTSAEEHIADAEFSENMLAATAESGKTGLIQTNTEKNAEKPVVTELMVLQKTDEPEFSATELSEQELFTVGRLIGQPDEQKLIGEENGKPLFESSAAITEDTNNPSRYSREMIKTETVSTHTATTQKENTTAQTAVNASAMAASDPGENTKTLNAQTKTRTETAGTHHAAAEKTSGAAYSQQTEARKTLTQEKDGRNRLEEVRNRRFASSGRRGASLEVHDFRSQTGDSALKEGVGQLRTVSSEARLSGDGSSKDIILELRLPNQGQASVTSSWETRLGQTGQTLENMLARELHQNMNSDIVRHASLLLRDGNEGTIRLALKPESLGNVKIQLEMAENKITGKIVVESEETLRAFKREIASLEKAFRDSGFDAANLEMSLSADGRGAEQQWQEAEASQFLPAVLAASRYDAAIERIEMPVPVDMYYQGTRAVNVLV